MTLLTHLVMRKKIFKWRSPNDIKEFIKKLYSKMKRPRSLQRRYHPKRKKDIKLHQENLKKYTGGRWGAEIRDVITNKRCWLRSLDNTDEIALVYNKTTVKIIGVNALINFLSYNQWKETICTTKKTIGMQLHICLVTFFCSTFHRFIHITFEIMSSEAEL
uniref:AP2/ERF domain-containing protein n=1 Tax=Solanum lycopersicum TaxID=4081 RepID=A0A3Q7EWK1_SOLLC